MKAIIVDDENLLLDEFQYECGGISELEILGYFSEPMKALEFAKTHPLDIAFVDLRMPEMDGLTLADELRALDTKIKVVVITAFEEGYEPKAIKKMDGIILKPYERENVEKIVRSLL